MFEIFAVNRRDIEIAEDFIFFTSVYDFEGGEPIGELELVKRVADLVGNGRLLVKTHPRDTRTIYIDEGFHVDKGSSIPWEVIQLSGNFNDKVFLTATSGSVLAGSFMTEEPVRTFYLYKLCDISRNPSAQKSSNDIETLLSDKALKDVLRRVAVAEKFEDIFWRVPKRAKESKTWRLQIWYTEVVKVHKYAVWKGARHVLPYL